jgi:hypothetical protein
MPPTSEFCYDIVLLFYFGRTSYRIPQIGELPSPDRVMFQENVDGIRPLSSGQDVFLELWVVSLI